MEDWLNNPITWVLVFSVAGGILSAGIWIGKVNTDRRSLKEWIDEIRANIHNIDVNINKIFQVLPGAVIKGSSPLELTETGRDISKELGIKQWAQDVSDSLIDAVKDKEPFEIQEFCDNYVRNQFEPDEKQDRKIRKAVYERAIARTHILDVMMIELRDVLVLKIEEQRS